MRHDWILDVLDDMKTYAARNGLDALAAKVDEALRIARAELAAARGEGAGGKTGRHGPN
ncbi:hypothetical protein [Ruixingdingia sedimenti]|uniref:Uncharacterized protein n=1 Tax=Ruixingdingia sedimenti TaxID=3073604 RepID=A0ABU1FA03_9RHOB|nr:hypothetical protein [Xinfangfangia sp. LG-4]MDR5653677.1 hypothetical protein [Xinfangfangia sp. LG-4]